MEWLKDLGFSDDEIAEMHSQVTDDLQAGRFPDVRAVEQDGETNADAALSRLEDMKRRS